MLPALFTAVLIACSGPRPGACVPVDLGTYATSACAGPAMPAAAQWIGGHPAFRLLRIECRAGSAGA